MDFVDYKCLESLIIEGEGVIATEGFGDIVKKIGEGLKWLWGKLGELFGKIIDGLVWLKNFFLKFFKKKPKEKYDDEYDDEIEDDLEIVEPSPRTANRENASASMKAIESMLNELSKISSMLNPLDSGGALKMFSTASDDDYNAEKERLIKTNRELEHEIKYALNDVIPKTMNIDQFTLYSEGQTATINTIDAMITRIQTYKEKVMKLTTMSSKIIDETTDDPKMKMRLNEIGSFDQKVINTQIKAATMILNSLNELRRKVQSAVIIEK